MIIFEKKSIRTEIFSSSIILSSVFLVIFGVFLSKVLYDSGMSKARDIIKQRNYAVNFFIDGYFSEINNTIEILAANEFVQYAPYLGDGARQQVIDLYNSFSKANKNITYIYSAYENKELLIDNYVPPDGYDPTIRPWYTSAMNKKPELATGVPYHEIKSREWLLATSKALYSKDRGYTGVVSSDSTIDVVVKQVAQRGDIYKSSYSFVVKPDGEIILHHDGQYIKKNISEVIGKTLEFDKDEGAISYQLGEIDKIAYYSNCIEADWIVVTTVNKDEITKPIIYQIFIYVILTGLIALLLGCGQSVILSKRFSKPLIQLQKRVESVIQGDLKSGGDEMYPDNEIGAIAQEVGRLAEDELCVRSSALQAINELLAQRNDELIELSSIDQLTGLYNRRKIDTGLESECLMAVRYKKGLSIMLLDIDCFKTINDTYGHQAGDSVLKEVASLLKDSVRSIDIVGRWGGEEFMIICPETNLLNAEKLGNRVCSLVAKHQFEVKHQVTVSVGISEFSGNENCGELLRRADNNLYKAKHNGKNRVIAT